MGPLGGPEISSSSSAPSSTESGGCDSARIVHFVYILRCADGTLYTGYARDLEQREKLHNLGRGARYTSGRRPVQVVYSESFELVGEALRREYEIKQWPRAKKEALIGANGRPFQETT